MLDLFEVRVPIAELLIRGTAIFWFLFLLFRFVIRRGIGAVGIADVLLLVIVADAAQNAMSGPYTTITEGCILIATIVGWNVLLDWLAFRLPSFRRFAQPHRLLLVDAGEPQQRNLARQFITLEELQSKLRQQGIESLADVKKAYLEGDGEVSVIRYPSRSNGTQGHTGARKRTPGA
jgi:uncharacterized membrane protein YcaP (DUF421 family)